MPWDLIPLSNGTSIPSIAYGTGTLGSGQWCIDNVDLAMSLGFSHIDTAQLYRNEYEAGIAIHDSGLSRSDIFITTKYSGVDGLDIPSSIRNSVDNLGVEFVDLYLIHNADLAVPDIPTVWAQMEQAQNDGLAKNIGVSNFNVPQLETLLASAKIKPAANQILFHPYVLDTQLPILEFGNAHGIVTEAYSVLNPLTSRPGGPVDAPVQAIATRLSAQPDQVLLAWAKTKGVVVVTASTKQERMEGYLAAGDLELTDEDIASIDSAGRLGARRFSMRTLFRRAAAVALVGAVLLGACSYMGVDVL